jgi:hypothetical protein
MNSKLSKKIVVSNLSPYKCANFPTHGERLRKNSCLEYHNFLENYHSKKFEKNRDERRRIEDICDILAKERFLKIQYTIYGDFLKKVRKLSHKYSRHVMLNRGCEIINKSEGENCKNYFEIWFFFNFS